MAELSQGTANERTPLHVGKMVNYAGAAVSLALLVGVGVWGYKLVMRDVTGIPVVRAMEGPMRTAPTEPGGEVAPHIGLAVNAVPAMGEAAPPEDTLILAPREVELSEEDLEAQPMAEAGEVVASIDASNTAEPDAIEPVVAETVTAALPAASAPLAEPVAAPSSAPMTAEQVLALADQIASESAPLEPLGAGAVVPAVTQLSGAEGANRIAADVPGVKRSPRPSERPAGLDTAVVASATPDMVESAPQAAPIAAVVDPGAIPAGTTLAQLGAFESADIAATEWTRISTKFSDYMSEKQQVVQRASSGGRTFYRLRAMGFTDMADARRFCAVLVDQDAACIPVVVR